MRFEELLVEDKQLDELNVGKAITGVAKGVGKAIGGVAKGVGAVAGGIAGIPGAIKKGFQAGKATVAGDNTAAQTSTTKTNTTGSTSPAAGANTSTATSAPATTATPAASSTAPTTSAPATTATPAASSTAPTTSAPATTAAVGQQTTASGDAVTKLQDRIFNLDSDNQREILKVLQTQASKSPEQDKKGSSQPNDQQSAQDKSLSPSAFGKMATDLAGGAQKAADAKPQQTQQPLPAGGKGQRGNFDAQTGEPLTQYGQQQKSQADLKAKLKSGGGLAKTSGSGFKQGMAKGNRRLGAGRGGVTMNHVPEGNPIIEFKQQALQENVDSLNFKIFKKQ